MPLQTVAKLLAHHTSWTAYDLARCQPWCASFLMLGKLRGATAGDASFLPLWLVMTEGADPSLWVWHVTPSIACTQVETVCNNGGYIEQTQPDDTATPNGQPGFDDVYLWGGYIAMTLAAGLAVSCEFQCAAAIGFCWLVEGACSILCRCDAQFGVQPWPDGPFSMHHMEKFIV